MNAILPPVSSTKCLNYYQRKIIVRIALRQSDPFIVRAERLRGLTFCTDDVKFEVLKYSDRISEGLYNCLYEIYFGEIKTEKENNTMTEEIKTPEIAKKKRWTDEDCRTLLHFHNKGTDIKTLAEMFDVSEKAVKLKLHNLKKQAKNNPADTSKASDKPKAKIFKASGIGFISVDGSMKIDDTPVTAALAKAISENGLKQFYGAVEIKVKPIQATGIAVSMEEE